MPSSNRARLSSSATPKRANSCGRKARAKPDIQPSVAQRIQHRQFAGELQRIVERRQHRAGDQPRLLRQLRGGGQEHHGIGAVAAIRMEVMLHGPDMAVAITVAQGDEPQRLLPIVARGFLRRADDRERTGCRPAYGYSFVSSWLSQSINASSTPSTPIDSRMPSCQPTYRRRNRIGVHDALQQWRWQRSPRSSRSVSA